VYIVKVFVGEENPSWIDIVVVVVVVVVVVIIIIVVVIIIIIIISSGIVVGSIIIHGDRMEDRLDILQMLF
jgi:hypothetical protein